MAQDNSPLEGIGFLIDEVREALFGEDDAGAPPARSTPIPVDLGTDTDLDLTGDGVVDRADLHEAGLVARLRRQRRAATGTGTMTTV